MNQLTFRLSTVALYAVFCLWLIGASWVACDHHFFYALDDPYIHLSVAENIARGSYGINSGDYSSPSSSVLYPFLLAPFSMLRVGEFAPLVMGLIAGGGSTWLLAGFVYRNVAAEDAQAVRPMWLLIAPLLIVSLNLCALPITGMEHPLHVLATIIIVIGLIDLGETGRVTRAMAACIILAPLIRFEGLALSGSTILVLAWKGERRWACGLSLALAACFGLYALLAVSHGLPPIPSSVMVKSSVSAAALDHDRHAMLSGVMHNLAASYDNRSGMLLILGMALMLPTLRAFRLRGSDVTDPRVGVALAAIASLAAHLVLGAYGWFGRYEVYAMAIMIMGVIYTRAEAIRSIRPAGLRLATCCLALSLPANIFLDVTRDTPAATRNIYQQQEQMHRFAVELFPRPVAVNDIGLTSWRNDQFVLDLWGLGSEDARKLAQSGRRTPQAIAALARRHGVAYAMVYDSWFPEGMPRDWQLVARLATSKVSSGDGVVSFYLVDPSQAAAMHVALVRLASTLPDGASLSFTQPAP